MKQSAPSTRDALLYALPVLFLSVVIGPAGSLIQGIYTREFGVGLATIAGAITLCKVLDALTDPLVGFVVDSTRHWRGGRKVWVVVGAVLLLAGATLLFNPTRGEITALSFFGAYFLTLFGWTVVEVAHLSWGSELATSYDQRSRIFAYRTGFLFAGTLLFLALPLLLRAMEGETLEQVLRAQYSASTLQLAFKGILAMFPIAVLISVLVCPKGEATHEQERVSLRAALAVMRRNKPFQKFVAMVVVFFIGNGMQVAMAYLHLSSYLQLGDRAPLIYAACFPLNLIMIPVWLRAMQRWEKGAVLAAGLGISATLFIALGLIQPGTGAFWQYFLIFALLQLAQPAWQILPPAIIGDISDHATVESGQEQTATLYAVYAFMYKAISGLGAAIGFALSAWLGFDPAHNAHSEAAAFGVTATMAYIPALLTMFAAWLAWRQPITRAQHALIRAKLEVKST